MVDPKETDVELRFDVDPDPDDPQAFLKASASRLPLLAAIVWITWPMIACPLAVVMALLDGESPSTAVATGAVFLVLSAPLSFVLWLLGRRSSVRPAAQGRPKLTFAQEPYSVTVNAKGVTVSQNGSVWRVGWNDVTDCLVTPTRLFFCAAGTTAVVVPARSFRSHQEFALCCLSTLRLRAQARLCDEHPLTVAGSEHSDAIELAYELTRDDALAFFQKTLDIMPRTMWRQLPGYAWMPLLLTAGFGWDAYSSYPWIDSPADLIAGLVGGVVASLALALVVFRMQRTATLQLGVRKEASVRRALTLPWVSAAIGTTVIRITPAGIHEVGPVMVADLQWTPAALLLKEPDYTYIYPGGRSASIVPRRAFTSDEEFEAFVAQAEAWREAAVAAAA